MTKKVKDNLSQNFIGVNYIIDNQFKFMYNYGITLVTLRDLIKITDTYLKSSKASTPTSLMMTKERAGSSFNSLYKRVSNMLNKGLINNIGTSDRMLLVPTELAIKELQALVNIGH